MKTLKFFIISIIFHHFALTEDEKHQQQQQIMGRKREGWGVILINKARWQQGKRRKGKFEKVTPTKSDERKKWKKKCSNRGLEKISFFFALRFFFLLYIGSILM